VTISRTRRLISAAAHQQVFGWVLKRLARGGLMKGKTIGIDSTTLEANAAMKSIVRRDTQEGYTEYLKRLAQAEGVEAEDAAAVRRLDRKRAKKMSNEEWVNPQDPEAEITRLKDGRTALAYKTEQAVDMETGAIVAVTTHGGATGDTESIGETLPQAGEAVAEQIAETTRDGKYPANFAGVEEVVADKGYHSNEVVRDLREWGVRTYIAEPERGNRKWDGRRAEQAAVYANRRRIRGARGKRLQAGRGERVERNFAHQFDTGGLDRLYVRGLHNVQKKLLIQAAACNLALLMRALYGAGKPRAAHDRRGELVFAILWLYSLLTALREQQSAFSGDPDPITHRPRCLSQESLRASKTTV
jgi:transposase